MDRVDLEEWYKRLDLEAQSTRRVKEVSVPEQPPTDAGVSHSNQSEVKGRGRSPRKLESREELLSRLMDPTLTLDEAAKLLEVCPTTIRRWTNKGILSCERSAGNQRRFKLSDIEAFLRSRSGTDPAPAQDL